MLKGTICDNIQARGKKGGASFLSTTNYQLPREAWALGENAHSINHTHTHTIHIRIHIRTYTITLRSLINKKEKKYALINNKRGKKKNARGTDSCYCRACAFACAVSMSSSARDDTVLYSVQVDVTGRLCTYICVIWVPLPFCL